MPPGAPAVRTSDRYFIRLQEKFPMSPLEDFPALLLSSSSSVLGSVAMLLLLAFASRRLVWQETRKGPPGPRPLPVLGNLLQLDLKRLHISLCELAERYGSVFTVHIGGSKMVVLAGYKTVREALVSHAEEFGERHIEPIYEDMHHGDGIVFTNGDSWKELRRFVISTLREFGMGKKLAEDKIMEECSHLLALLEKQEGQPFDTASPVSKATSNIICSIVFGSRFAYDDTRFTSMVERVNDGFRMTGSKQIQLYNSFPWLFCWVQHRRMILQGRDNSVQDIKDLMAKLKEKLNPQACTGLVDCFFMHKQKAEDLSAEQNHFSENNMVFVVFNLFSAGTDTTSTTLQWALLLMAKYPQIQDRVQEELSRVIGARRVCMEDRKNLPYTDAVIHEVQRFANVVPLNVLHQTSRDVTFQGHFIEKGTVVLPLLTSVLFDKSEWETPNTFNPSHFLDEEGHFIKRDAFMPFSAGPRVCLGEVLVRMELFLFFTTLLQRFRFTPPPGTSEDELGLTPVVGFTLKPPPHKLCAVSRR